MNMTDTFRRYFGQTKVLQVATVKNRKPWIATVYFVADKSLNLYWLSLPTRRHSMEIMDDRHVAIAIAVKTDQPVIGIQGEGTVEVVTNAGTVQGIMEKYVAKYDSGHDFYDNFVQGTNKHRMYRFTPERYALFDEVNYPDSSPVELLIPAVKD